MGGGERDVDWGGGVRAMAQLKADFTIDVITDFEIGRSVGTQIRNDFVAAEINAWN